MALIAHRMILSKGAGRANSTRKQLARNKVGVLLVPSLAGYYNEENRTQRIQQQSQQRNAFQMQQDENEIPPINVRKLFYTQRRWTL